MASTGSRTLPGMDADELLGIAEIAAAFGVERNSAWRWSRRPEFPEPVARLSAGPVYRRGDVERWHREGRPRPGRPPRASE